MAKALEQLAENSWYGISTYSTGMGYSLDHMLEEFVNVHLIPEKGPDFVDVLLKGDDVQYYRIHSWFQTTNHEVAMEHVARGWLMLPPERNADPSTGDIQTLFNLAHPEENAV